MPNIVCKTPAQIETYRLLALKYALALECKGIRTRRFSAFARVKREFGLKGKRQHVYEQFTKLLDAMLPIPEPGQEPRQ